MTVEIEEDPAPDGEGASPAGTGISRPVTGSGSVA